MVCVCWTSAAPTHRRAVGWKGNPPVSPGESPAADRPRFLLCTMPAQPVVREHAPGARANTRRPAPSSAERELGETQRPGSTHSNGPCALGNPAAPHTCRKCGAQHAHPNPPNPQTPHPYELRPQPHKGGGGLRKVALGGGSAGWQTSTASGKQGAGGRRAGVAQTKLNCKRAAPPTNHTPPLPPPLPSQVTHRVHAGRE